MGNDIIGRLKGMGIKVEKTKSRQHMLSAVYYDDPQIHAYQASLFSQLSCMKDTKQKLNEI